MAYQNLENNVLSHLPATLLDSIPIGVLFCDTDCIVRFINKTYAGYLGIDRHSAVGKKITELIPSSRAAIVIQSDIPEMGGTCRISRIDGQDVTLIVNRLPVKDDAGSTLGFVSQSLIADTDELKGLAEKISQLDRKVAFYRRRMQSALSAIYSLQNILGHSPALLKVKEKLSLYAKTESPVLILGATGTGKELFASALHLESQRSDGSFVSINCAAIPQELFESELFGYVGGSFSGARKEGKVGQIELADNGTLFLDEIGDMPMQIQAKLLRVIEDKNVFRLGSTTPHKVDFRLVAATNRDLGDAIKKGVFREDLYYRICSLVLTIPTLSDRTEDIPQLISHFLDKLDRRDITFSARAMDALISYSWPGNIRQLRNVVQGVVSLCRGHIIELADLPSELLAQGPYCEVKAESAGVGRPLASIRNVSEYKTILSALDRNGWNMVRTAKDLGVSRATLYKKTSKLGIKRQAE